MESQTLLQSIFFHLDGKREIERHYNILGWALEEQFCKRNEEKTATRGHETSRRPLGGHLGTSRATLGSHLGAFLIKKLIDIPKKVSSEG